MPKTMPKRNEETEMVTDTAVTTGDSNEDGPGDGGDLRVWRHPTTLILPSEMKDVNLLTCSALPLRRVN